MAFNVPGYTLLRKVNRRIKHIKKERNGLIITPSRRIERVAPMGERVVAMTFDDGPMKLPTEPDIANGKGLTEHLLDTLAEFGARGSFDVIGSTAENYPDESGELGSQYVFGKKYDHYAAFGLDDMAGADACPELIRRIAREGHELTNHTYRHVIYGKSRAVYGSRATMRGLDEAVSDLTRLHELIKKLTLFEMRFTRPPHYVDKMPDGHTSYDACEIMGYHYLSASFDGGGYLPSCGDFDEDVEKMVRPLREALESEPNSLAGQIIFQKDGYNMSRQTPIAKALRLQLELLERYGYRVLTAGELLERSPFEDVRPSNNCFEAVRALDKAGFATGFRNNRFYPEREVTRQELPVMFSPPGGLQRGVKIDKSDTASIKQIVTYADGVFEELSGQPMSSKRGDVAIWLHNLAQLNGYC